MRVPREPSRSPGSWPGAAWSSTGYAPGPTSAGVALSGAAHYTWSMAIEPELKAILNDVLSRQDRHDDAIVKLTEQVTRSAVLINALAVMAGFLVIVASELIILKHFGALCALSIGLTALGALTIYPVLILTFDRRTIAPAASPPELATRSSQGGIA